jgi:hypothetical protein
MESLFKTIASAFHFLMPSVFILIKPLAKPDSKKSKYTEGIKKWKADAIVLNKDANQTVQQSVFKSSDVEGLMLRQRVMHSLHSLHSMQ